MPGASDWQNLPNSLTQAWDASQQADDWALEQNAQNAQDWANTQKSIPPPPTPSDSLTNPLGTGNAPVPSPSGDQTAGVGVVPSPTPQAAPAVSPPPSGAPPADTGPSQSNGQTFSPYDDTFRKYAGDLANDPEFIKIVAAGTLAESSWNANSTSGDGGHSWGLFQMHDAGMGAGMGNARLDPDAASAVMVPRYAAAYKKFTAQGLQGPQLAAAVGHAAELNADASGSGYAAAYRTISGGNAPNVVSSAQNFLGAAGNAISNAAQGAVDTAKQVLPAVGGALQDFAQNGPIGATRNAVQGAVQDVTSGQAKQDLGNYLATQPDIPGVPGSNLAMKAASGIITSPTILDQMQTMLGLLQKYPKQGSPGPDFDAMTPEDAQAWKQATLAIGAMTSGEGGEGRPLFGRGGVPGADVGRNPLPEPTQPQDLEATLTQMFKQAGATDDQIQRLKNGGTLEQQVNPAAEPSATATTGGSSGQPPEPPTSVGGGEPLPPDQPPPIQFDVNGNVVATNGVPVAGPMQNVTPQGDLASGVQNIPGRAGGAEPPTMPKSQRPDLLISPGASGDGTATAPNVDPNAPPPSSGGLTPGQALAGIGAEAKKSIFSLSNVHAGNIFRGLVTSPAGPQGAAQFAQRYVTALARGPQDPAAEAGMVDLAQNAMRDGVNFFGGQNPETGGAGAGFNPVLVAAARAVGGGVLGAAGGAQYANATGDDQNVLRDAVIGGAIGALGGPTVAVRMHDALWKDAVPFAKLLTYQSAVNAGVDGRQAAMFANNLNGGQNLAAIAGSKPVQELARWALQSPDWLLSQVKLTGAGVAGTAKTIAQQPLTGNEQLSRDWLLKTLLTYGFATEAIQFALSGHFTNENSPGSQFQIEVPSGENSPTGKPQNITTSLFPGNLGQILDAADRATQGPGALGLTAWDKTNRIPATAVEEWGNFRYPGGPPITSKNATPDEAAQQRAVFAGSQFAPLGIFSPASEVAAGASPAATAFLTALGFPMSHNTRPTGGATAPTRQPIRAPSPSSRPKRKP